MELTRRNFLSASAAAVATGAATGCATSRPGAKATSAVIVAGAMAQGRVFGANEKINVCVMGCGGRGSSHIDGFAGKPNSEVVALCDPDSAHLEGHAKLVEKKSGKKPKLYKDIREALADKEIDAVSIATPNHWHTLGAVWAAQAGKHVYVEKPGSHDIYEGQQLVAAAEKGKVVMQHGTQSRSSERWLRDIPLLQSGEIIGPLYMARGLCYKNGGRGDLGIKKDCDPPAELDWDIWQGPASRRKFNPLYHPYNWHWFWHYGNGEIGNQGIHQLDICVWGMNRGFPVRVDSVGGRYTYKDGAETPNTNIATYIYEDGTMMVFEVRNRFTNSEGGVEIDGKYVEGVDVGNLFYGNGGYYVEGQGFFDKSNRPIPVDYSKYPKVETKGNWENFLAAVKAGDKTKVYGDMKAAHLSSGHAHLAGISYRAGTSLAFDPKAEKFTGYKAEEANKMLTREYAKGFEVPKFA